MDLMQRRRVMLAAGKRKVVKKAVTSSSNSVSFSTRIAAPIFLECNFREIQEGSGKPSPANVRPIYGFGKTAVTLNGDNIDIFYPTGTVYGGRFSISDDGHCTLNQTRYRYEIDSARWRWQSGSWVIDRSSFSPIYYYNSVVGSNDGYIHDITCDKYFTANYNNSANYYSNCVAIRQYNVRWFTCQTNRTSNLRPENISVVLPLETPILNEFNDAPIIADIGENQISVNLNGGITVEYYDYE